MGFPQDKSSCLQFHFAKINYMQKCGSQPLTIKCKVQKNFWLPLPVYCIIWSWSALCAFLLPPLPPDWPLLPQFSSISWKWLAYRFTTFFRIPLFTDFWDCVTVNIFVLGNRICGRGFWGSKQSGGKDISDITLNLRVLITY